LVYEIASKKELSSGVFRMEVEAPKIARKRKAGQFVILRVVEHGERVPLTIAGADPDKGTVTLIFQAVGRTTMDLAQLNVGDDLLDLVGPLGTPTHVEKYGHCVCVGGGIGIAPMLPIAAALKEAGNKVTGIIGARTKDLMILEDEMREACHELLITTDDGSYVRKGLVTHVLEELIQSGDPIDLVVAIGPPIMMKFVCKTTEPHQIKTLVSLNAVMVDGTGMCGGCRVTVGGKIKFTCVDGPEFDGHAVDFDELMRRQRTYVDREKHQAEHHECHAIQHHH
jgi:ferredoxin--NADP+ reductase